MKDNQNSADRAGMTTEQIIWKGTPSQITHLPALIVGIVVASAISVALGFIGWIWPLYLAIAGVVWLACLTPWLWESLKTRFFNYELTTERLKLTTGIFNRHTDVLELYRVKDMSIAQPFVLRLFGLSNVSLTTSDRTTPVLILRAIRNGPTVLDTIRNRVEVLREKKRVREVDFEGDDVNGFED